MSNLKTTLGLVALIVLLACSEEPPKYHGYYRKPSEWSQAESDRLLDFQRRVLESERELARDSRLLADIRVHEKLYGPMPHKCPYPSHDYTESKPTKSPTDLKYTPEERARIHEALYGPLPHKCSDPRHGVPESKPIKREKR